MVKDADGSSSTLRNIYKILTEIIHKHVRIQFDLQVKNCDI